MHDTKKKISRTKRPLAISISMHVVHIMTDCFLWSRLKKKTLRELQLVFVHNEIMVMTLFTENRPSLSSKNDLNPTAIPEGFLSVELIRTFFGGPSRARTDKTDLQDRDFTIKLWAQILPEGLRTLTSFRRVLFKTTASTGSAKASNNLITLFLRIQNELHK
jgi:hypothetical protein